MHFLADLEGRVQDKKRSQGEASECSDRQNPNSESQMTLKLVNLNNQPEMLGAGLQEKGRFRVTGGQSCTCGSLRSSERT